MRKTLILLLLALLVGGSSQIAAQTKMGRYHKNLLYEADLYFIQGDYYYASELYNELLKVEPDNADLLGKIGISYWMLPTFKKRAVSYLEPAVKGDHTESMYYLAKARHENYRFHEAIELLDRYHGKAQRLHSEDEIKRLREAVVRSMELVENPLPVTITNLGSSVNSEVHDYCPVWDNSTNRIYFTSRRRMDDKSEKDYSEQFDENIYYVDLNELYPAAQAAPSPLNTRTNDAAVAISADGSKMIIYRTSKDGLSGDLFISGKLVDSWSDPQKLDSRINSKSQEASACFGNDEGTVIYFSSDRPGGFGGKDLYMVKQLPDGSWGQPMNLGETVNSHLDEDAPFVSAKGELYFSSNGHAGMGGFDVYYSVPGATSWSEPVNVGYPINTPGDDIFFVTDPDGKTGYFSSDRYGGLGLQDLYKVVFDEMNSVICRLSLETEGEELPPSVFIKLMNEQTGTLEGYFQTETINKSVILPLQANRNYLLIVEAEGFITTEKSIFYESAGDGMVERSEKLRIAPR